MTKRAFNKIADGLNEAVERIKSGDFDDAITHPGAVQSDEQQIAWRETIAHVWRIFRHQKSAAVCRGYVDQAVQSTSAEVDFTLQMMSRHGGRWSVNDQAALEETKGRFRAYSDVQTAIQHATTAEECRNIVAVIGNRGPR